jgi:hypothetical protein
MRKLNLFSALIFSLCSFTASAQEFKPGFYGVATAGPTKLTSTTGASWTMNGYQLGGGYEFSKNLSGEITYGSLMKYQYTSESSTVTQSYNVNMLTYSGTLKLPISEVFIPYATLGKISGNVSSSYSGSGYAYSSAGSGSRTLYGFGVEIPLEARTSFRIQHLTSSRSTVLSKIDSTTAGFIFKF